MAKLTWLLLGGVLIVGCGAPKPTGEASLPTIQDPANKPAISQTAEKKPVDAAAVKAVFDLDEYPGVEQVSNNQLVDGTLPPDEMRFELVRRSKDAPEKVIKFYEEKLGQKAFGSAGTKELFGRTQRGNDVKIKISPEGTGTKFSLVAISYKK